MSQRAPEGSKLPLDRLQHWMQAVIETPGDAAEAVAAPGAAKIVRPDHVGDVVVPSMTL